MADRKRIAEEIVFVAQGRGVDFADVRVAQDVSTRVTVQDGRAEKMSTQREAGAGIRVLVDGAWGFVSADTFSRTALLSALDEAIELARASSARVTDPGMVATATPAVTDYAAPFGRDPRTVDAREKLAAVKGYEEAARKHGGSAIVNSIVSYSDYFTAETVANTRGTLVDQQITRVVIRCQVAVSADGMTQSAMQNLGIVGGYELVEGTPACDFSIKAVDKAVALLKAKPAPAGRFPVIFHPSATGLFTHEAIGHNAEADAVWAGASIVGDRMGQEIAGDAVTIIDDPTFDGAFGFYLFDSEGTPAKRKVIVEKGVLREWLHSLETAARLGMSPNGSGRAESHAERPLVRMSNTFIAPGRTPLDDMIKSIDRGIYFGDAHGGHVLPERGLFTCAAGRSMMIENGKLGEPLRDVSVSGLTLEMLRNIEMVGDDLEVAWPGYCGKGGQSVPTAIGGPHVKISSMTVGGRVA